MIVETGHWYAGRRIRLLPEHIERIDYAASVVLVRLTKEDIDHTTAGGMAHPAAAAP